MNLSDDRQNGVPRAAPSDVSPSDIDPGRLTTPSHRRWNLQHGFQSARMSRGRLVRVHLLLAVLVGMSAYDITTGQEHWPFSPYPMFAEIDERPALTALRLFGVTDEEQSREIPLRDDALIAPFDQCRIAAAFSQAYHDPEGRPRVRELLEDSLRRYESQRVAALHQGPPLRAIRLYSMEWSLDPQGRNVDAPEQQRLLEQVDWPRRSSEPAADVGRAPSN